VCEIGVYGAMLRDAEGAELLNCTAGYLLRTKSATGNETGVAAVSACAGCTIAVAVYGCGGRVWLRWPWCACVILNITT
jgi:hypothetical protein